MRVWVAILGIAVLFASSAQAQIAGCTPDFSDPIQVSVETSVGEMILELYPNMAPITVANFLAYMDRGDYDGAIFHRSVPGFVIQGGGFREGPSGYEAIPTDPPILNEPCLSNTAGTIAMARLGGQPNSATSQWFVNLVDNTFLDSTDGVGFTAFGRVVFGGMDVADDIAALPIEDTLAILELPFNQIFREMPLQAATTGPPGGYGCSRTSPGHGLLDESQNFLIVDPLRHGGALVPILLDPACTGAGATGPPTTVACTPGIGRDVAEGTISTSQYFPPPIAMTCDQIAESEASWAARRADTEAQYFGLDVEMVSVPEPSGAVGVATGVSALVALARRRSHASDHAAMRRG